MFIYTQFGKKLEYLVIRFDKIYDMHFLFVKLIFLPVTSLFFLLLLLRWTHEQAFHIGERDADDKNLH